MLDALKNHIISALDPSWTDTPMCGSLPPYTKLIHCAHAHRRGLAFLYVQGEVRTALPYFEANARFRQIGIDPIWLFDVDSLPSTRRMLCLQLNYIGSLPVCKIINGSKRPLPLEPQDLAAFVKAASEDRLKVSGFSAGQVVEVDTCVLSQLTTATGLHAKVEKVVTFHPTDHPGAPGLSLSAGSIGKNIARLLAGAKVIGAGPSQIRLTGQAALELIRYERTNWYMMSDH